MLRIVFDVPRLKVKRRELEQISSQPEFWDNQEEAKKQMLILDDVKAQLELLDNGKLLFLMLMPLLNFIL